MNIPRRSISLLSLSLLNRNNLKDRGTYYKYRCSAVFFYAIDTVLKVIGHFVLIQRAMELVFN